MLNAFLALIVGVAVGLPCGWLLRKNYGTRADKIKDKLEGQ